VSAKANAKVGAVLWSLVVAVVVTAIVHALALNLPDWMSARASRQASSFEKTAARFSEAWTANAFVLAGAVAAVSFIVVLPLFLWRASVTARRATVSTPTGSGAG
jgi:hypothetical protein